MERRVMADLEAWWRRADRKPLVLRGVRQSGKTWLLREFGRRRFTSQIYLNFEKEPALAGLFEQDLDAHRIIRNLSILRNQAIDPATTLIIMDEIQACPPALTSLKYFAEDASEYAVAAAGSLLGLAIHDAASFPVGKVDFLDLHPLTFGEFMTAGGHARLADYLAGLTPGTRPSPALTAQAEDLLRQYLTVGGMPEAVASWHANQDISRVEEIQQAILDSYVLDMAKHATAKVFPKLTAIWRSIPRQLGRANDKFIFSQAVAGARAKDLEDALEWLTAAGIAVKITTVSHPAIPLSSYADDKHFKLFVCDVGLLRKMAEVPAAAIMTPTGAVEHFQGPLTENYVLMQLIAAGHQPYSWRSGNTAEVDFLIQYGTEVVPIEVKSGSRTRSRSLGVYKSRYGPALALTLSLKPTVNGHLPLYAAWSVGDYLGRLG